MQHWLSIIAVCHGGRTGWIHAGGWEEEGGGAGGVEECMAIIAEEATHRRSETMCFAKASRVEAILMSRQRRRPARLALMMRKI